MHNIPTGLVVELVWCVGRDVDGLADSRDPFPAAESDLNFALENGEHLLEIVAVGRRTAAGRDVHVDEAVAADGVLRSRPLPNG
jgi:hypothetical protein